VVLYIVYKYFVNISVNCGGSFFCRRISTIAYLIGLFQPPDWTQQEIPTFNNSLADLKEQYHEGIEWDILPWLRKNKRQIGIFGYLAKKIHSAY
jgi:hypothetical protein